MQSYQTKNGRVFNIRPITNDDRIDIELLFCSLSSHSLWLRFMSPIPAMSVERAYREAARLYQHNPKRKAVLVATIWEGRRETVVGVGELWHDQQDHSAAEMALVVRDDYQHEGIGTALIEQLSIEATKSGFSSWRGYTLAENKAARKLVQKLSGLTSMVYSRDELLYSGKVAVQMPK